VAAGEGDDDRLLTADEVASLMQVTLAWVYAESRRDALPHVRLGRYIRFRRSAIERWLEGLDGRWRTGEGRKLNRKVAAVRSRAHPDGLTKKEAEKKFVHIREDEARREQAASAIEPQPAPEAPRSVSASRTTTAKTVNEVADSLRCRQAIEGCRKSYKEGCESMQRVHFCKPCDNPIGERPVEEVGRVHGVVVGVGAQAQYDPQHHHLPRLLLRARDPEAVGEREPGAVFDASEAAAQQRR
jgi:excisionase family DNA binding protein